jgi:hypothetical protein
MRMYPRAYQGLYRYNQFLKHLGIVGGVAIGAEISWWIYNRQKKTSRKQDDIMQRIQKVEEKNRRILAHLKAFAKHHDSTLNKIFSLNENILALDKKIDS